MFKMNILFLLGRWLLIQVSWMGHSDPRRQRPDPPDVERRSGAANLGRNGAQASMDLPAGSGGGIGASSG